MTLSLAVRLALLASLAPALRAQQAIGLSEHGIPNGNLGTAMIHVADVNNDGYDDLLVGQPQLSGTGPGGIWCVSGKHLGLGASPDVIWSCAPNLTGVSGAARFGWSLCAVATLTGDATTDFVVGAPNYIPPGSTITTGALFLVDGATHAIAGIIEGEANTHLGQALVAVGDQDGDGKIDIAASAIPVSSTDPNSKVHVIPGSSFTSGTHSLASVAHLTRAVGWHDYGAALASGFDLDHDGRWDLAVSIPSYGFSFPGSGYVEVLRALSGFPLLGGFTTLASGEHMGTSIDARHDYNGDGIPDLVCGAPDWNPGVMHGIEAGRAYVVSGAGLLNNALPLYLYTLSASSGPSPTTAHFGAAVCASEDLNGDGIGDILIGSPDYRPSFPFNAPVKGAVYVYSGATGMRIGSLIGNSNERLGDALVGGFDTLDGDVFPEFAVAASTSDSPYVDCGVIKAVSLFPAPPGTYCGAKLNSLGCWPSMSWSGASSATTVAPFLVTCSSMLNQKTGFLTYSRHPASTPFQGGTLCIQAPILRTPAQNSGGSTSGNDCTGAYSFDFNAWIQSGVDPSLVVGADVFMQYRSRDPQSTGSSSLSNALRFLVNP